MNNSLKINPEEEVEKIVKFINLTLKKQGFKNVIIGMSGGVDSATCFSLLAKAISSKNIFIALLPYFESQVESVNLLLKKNKIPQDNVCRIRIKSIVEEFQKMLKITKDSESHKVRLGNIMARVRMTILYDFAKKENALVCGTENKSEFYLGYFTRFGDEASDFEPVRHLYKTQIYQLAKYLNIPKEIIASPPTAGLWPEQTDEKELSFSYKEADQVINLYFDQKKPFSEISSKHFPNARKIISRISKNSFKHHSPYTIEESSLLNKF